MYLRHNWLPAAAIGVYGAAVVLVAHLGEAAPPTLCLFRLTTGIPCPGCGTTRAALALVAGGFGEALRENPLAVCMLLLAALGGAVWLLARALRRTWRPRLRGGARVLVFAALGVAVALNWAYLITCSPSRVGTHPTVWVRLRRGR